MKQWVIAVLILLGYFTSNSVGLLQSQITITQRNTTINLRQFVTVFSKELNTKDYQHWSIINVKSVLGSHLINELAFYINHDTNFQVVIFDLHFMPPEEFTQKSDQSLSSRNKGQCNLSGAHLAYILVADTSEEVLENIENIKKSQLFWNPRAFFLIILFEEYCVSADIKHVTLFRGMWKNNSILNIIMASVKYEHLTFKMSKTILMYDPFTLNEASMNMIILSLEHPQSLNMAMSSKVLNLKGLPLRVSMFPRQPTAIPVGHSVSPEKFTGKDGEALSNLERYMNFTVWIVTPAEEKEEYGRRLSNGVFTGGLGDVLSGKADVALNGYFVKSYGTQDIEFTGTIYYDYLCILAPKVDRVPKWTVIFKSLSTDIYIYRFVLFILSCGLLYLMRNLESRYNGQMELSTACLDMFYIFISGPIIRIPRTLSQKLLIICCIFFSLIMSSVFEGRLVTTITKPDVSPDIVNLQQLDESQLMIATGSKTLDDTFRTTDRHSYLTRLSKKIKHLGKKESVMNYIAEHMDVAGIVRKSSYQYQMSEYVEEDGNSPFYMIPECPRQYFLAYIVPKGSVFLPRINRYLLHLTQGGLFIKWDADSMFRILLDRNHNLTLSSGRGPKVFTVSDLEGAFYILIVGLSTSLVIFFVEIMKQTL